MPLYRLKTCRETLFAKFLSYRKTDCHKSSCCLLLIPSTLVHSISKVPFPIILPLFMLFVGCLLQSA
jgi:hypothetical protein